VYLEIFSDINFITDVDLATLLAFKGTALYYWKEFLTVNFFIHILIDSVFCFQEQM